MNRLLAYRRLFWTLIIPALQSTAIIYAALWFIIFGGFLPQEVCDTAAFTDSVSTSRASSSSSEFPAEILSAPSQLQECLDDLVFQQQYALSSARPELREIAPVIKEVIILIEAFNPSFLDWHHKLYFFVEDIQTRHIIFSAHLNACLAIPKHPPRPLGARVLNPLPEASSILHGYFFLPWRAHPPTTLQVHRQLQWQYARFRSPSAQDLKALQSHPGRTQSDAFSQALAPALQIARAHTTGKVKTLQLLYRDMAANPSHATRTLDSLGRRWGDSDPLRLARQRGTLDALDRAAAHAGAFVRKVGPFLPRTERELLELDARFGRVAAGDLVQGHGAVAVQRFEAQMEAVLVLPAKAGMSEVGWRRVREGAERGLGIWRGGEGVGVEGIVRLMKEEAGGAREEREL